MHPEGATPMGPKKFTNEYEADLKLLDSRAHFRNIGLDVFRGLFAMYNA